MKNDIWKGNRDTNMKVGELKNAMNKFQAGGRGGPKDMNSPMGVKEGSTPLKR